MIHTSTSKLSGQEISHDPNIFKKVFLSSEKLPNITQIATTALAPSQEVPEHSHLDMAEVFYVLSGKGTIKVNGTPLPLSEGTFVLVEAKEKHHLINNGESTLELFYFGIKTKS